MPSSGVFVLPTQTKPRGAELRRQVLVLLLHPAEVFEEAHSLVHRVAGRMAQEILQNERHSPEGPVGEGGKRLSPCLLE